MRKVISGVYLMTSELNELHYVGASIDCCNRWRDHLNRLAHPYTKEFLVSLKANSLSFFLLEECTKKNLRKREQYWMDQFPNRVNKSRNVTNKGFKYSQETREKMKGMQNALGYKHSTDARKRIGLSSSLRLIGNQYGCKNKGCVRSKETREKIRQALKGKKLSTETVEKMRLAKLAYWERKRNGN